MPDRVPVTTEFASRSLRLDTLVRLRWLAVAGQAIAVLFVAVGLGFPLPTVGCLALVALSAVVNLALRLRFPGRSVSANGRPRCCLPMTLPSSAHCSF